MNKETLATSGALGLSVLIASCCIGPTLFLLFGVSVGALGMFSALEPYQPIFIGAGLAALAFAGYRIFRESPAEEACAADDACAPDSRSRRSTRRFFIVAVVLFMGAAAYPYVLNALL